MTDAPELKPCPFCGGRAIYYKDHTTECCDAIYCEKCDATVSDFNLEGGQGTCRELWNTRSDHALALVAAAYEAAAKKADHRWREWPQLAPHAAVECDVTACEDIAATVRSLTPADAVEAQRKRDAQTYKMAMEAAANRLRIRGDMGGHVFILAMNNPFEKDKSDE